ncbi:RBBP9/YdeN family alpha/beta hydrolase [Saccharothrix algeriensis]|uniref:Alpha/beta hydrolase family esterase n=1 Tax=Saccharothrix algeriensis TaxID=173560 RepID=A0ABS2S443_9PSEU|nr:alpha/beta hydrolase [Saccharothrix algeriensis]MBM7810993.1 putative alpha/beta hydrolase family esterase [Saccharothrix algeriensis]
MSLPYALVLHGLGGSGPEHWQNWLAGELAHRGGQVDLPQFTLPDAPQLDVWLAELREHLAAAPREGERVVVAHSLACLLWLHHAAGGFDPALRVDRVLLVAPPSPHCTVEPLITGFLDVPLDPTAPRRAAASTRLVVGEGDRYCSVEQGKELAEALRVDVDVVVGGGHLNTESGYGSWNAVLKWVRSDRTPLTPR